MVKFPSGKATSEDLRQILRVSEKELRLKLGAMEDVNHEGHEGYESHLAL